MVKLRIEPEGAKKEGMSLDNSLGLYHPSTRGHPGIFSTLHWNRYTTTPLKV
jgi:hypothetical protein